MNKDALAPIFSTPASLWDGIRQLPGTLELWESCVSFRLSDFRNSHLNLVIPIGEIEKAEEYLVFDLARNGLRIESKGGRSDLFVLDDGKAFKKAIQGRMPE